jgi:site-specific DNA recombinase
MSRKAALYMRSASTPQIGKDESIDRQKSVTTEFCAKQGWSVVAEYSDRGVSGSTAERPAFQEMLGDLGLQKFEMLVVEDDTRLFRKFALQEVFRRFLAKNGVRVVSVSH